MNEHTGSSAHTSVPAGGPVIDLSAEGGIGTGEWVLIGVVAAAAAIFLIRKFAVRKQMCSSCGKTEGCAARTFGRNLR